MSNSVSFFLVMPGLVPGIHVFRCCGFQCVDGRDKPGHDKFFSRRVAPEGSSGIPSNASPTREGTRREVNGCDFYTFRDGKVVRKDSYWKIVE